MIRLFIFLFFLAAFGLEKAYAQDQLILLNGEIRTVEIVALKKESTSYLLLKKKKKKARIISNELIYRIKFQSGVDTLIYTKNESPNHTMSPENMQIYLYGMQDAKANFKAPWVFWGGVAFNAGVGFFLYDNFFAAAGPIAYTVGTSVSKIKIKNALNRPFEITRNPIYQEGYLKIAKSKKIYKAISGSLLGLLIGMGTGYATH